MNVRKILVGVEDTDEARSALRFAGRLASLEAATLTVVSVHTDEYLFITTEEAEEQRNIYFREMREIADDELSGPFSFQASAMLSAPAGITQVAENIDPDLIVIGSSHRGSIGRVLIGDAGSRLVTGAPCAVAVVPRGWGKDGSTEISRIGIGVNGSEESDLGIEYGSSLALDLEASVELLGVVPHVMTPGRVGLTSPGFQDVIREDLESRLLVDASRLPNPDVETRIRYGDAADELTEASDHLDIIVLGSRSYGPFGRVLLGGTAVKMMRSSGCPVIVIPRPSQHEKSSHGR